MIKVILRNKSNYSSGVVADVLSRHLGRNEYVSPTSGFTENDVSVDLTPNGEITLTLDDAVVQDITLICTVSEMYGLDV